MHRRVSMEGIRFWLRTSAKSGQKLMLCSDCRSFACRWTRSSEEDETNRWRRRRRMGVKQLHVDPSSNSYIAWSRILELMPWRV